MEILFCDLNYESKLFKRCNILDQDVEAVVSPANSFGFMDGGIDYAYSMFFGWGLQNRLQKKLEELPFGELLVGQSIVIPTGNEKIKYVVSAPTMRVPNVIHDMAEIYLAARSATYEANKAGIESLAFPGMGTGCGQAPFELAEIAMKRGCEDALNGYPVFKNWRDAQIYHFGVHL